MIEYELVIYPAGSAVLTCGGDVTWSSDDDDDFAEAFPDTLIEFEDQAQIDSVIDYLVEQGYVPPNTDVEVVEDDSDETGQMPALVIDDAEDETP